MNFIKLIRHIYREHWRRPRKGKVCPVCGDKFFNRGPHMKKCRGVIQHIAEEVAKGVEGDEGDLMPPPLR